MYCSETAHTPMILRQNLGDQIIPRLHTGMSRPEIDEAIGELKKYLVEEHTMTIQSEKDVYVRYGSRYFPKNLFDTVKVGRRFTSMAYWTNYAGKNLGTLELFFDEKTQRLQGRVNTLPIYARSVFT